MSIVVNDIHSVLNETPVSRIAEPVSCDELIHLVDTAAREKTPIAVCGGRHAMGGQQFFENELLVDCSKLNRILAFDHDAGTVTVEAGCTWPDLLRQYEKIQIEKHGAVKWGFAQKQTGADALTIGGAVSANAHGRGLLMKPLAGDVESVAVVTADGKLQTCSRNTNPELFRLILGGYGLFGVIYSVTLKLSRRRVLRRVVRVIDIEDAVAAAN